jgi:hypothetical protein
MLTITIKTPGSTEKPFDTKSGISKAGRPYTIHEQVGIADLPNGERRKVKLQLNEDKDGNVEFLRPGQYEPKPSAVYVGQFDALAISTRAHHWQAVKAAAARAA